MLVVLRVYLDQNHWVALSAARKGAAHQGRDVKDVLLLAEAGVDAGSVSFPLGMAHYLETRNRRSWPSRRDLANTMSTLSRFQTIAPQPDLIAPELDRAFVRRVGRPETPLPLQPFGSGVSFAFGMPAVKYSVPDGLELPVGARWLIEQTVDAPWQFFALAGLPPQTEDRLVGFDPRAHARLADQIAQDAESGRTLRRQNGYNRGAPAADWFAADVMSENIELLNAALDRARVPPAEVYAQGKDGLNALLEDIPTMHVTGLMRRHRHVASQKPIDRNDIMDLAALPSAIVYCDVVVTEVQHAAFARRQGVAERYGTIVLDNLRGLLPLLVAAA